MRSTGGRHAEPDELRLDSPRGRWAGVDNAVARTGSPVAVAAIPLIAGFTAGEAVDDALLLDGYGTVMWASACGTVAAGMVAAAWVRRIEPEQARVAPPPYHCAAFNPPVAVDAAESSGLAPTPRHP